MENPCTGSRIADRRSGVERRKRSLLAALFQRGPRRRRSAGRRSTDRGGYVDIYDWRTWAIAVSVVLLSLLDGLLTGLHILRGSASELNPVMAGVLRLGGVVPFFGLKALMTVLPMAIIVLHKEWVLGRYAARLCLWSYILVSLYHFYLIMALRAFGNHPFA